ncbi:protein lifeguard 4-like [Thrips palmi]|uniref:Protein lifeguard 4-like n=1 Tax=Thrips palmi TaxID=161013 RepID=A0A6P9AEX9_THRPL|nr:protein lifeguard 4-like [Thrips palmi]
MAALDTMPMLYAFDDMESGGKESSIENDFAYRNNVVNASQKIRMGFIRKVYCLLSMQLIISVIIGAVCMFEPHVKGFIKTNDWLVSMSFIASIVILIALHIKRRETPTNLILLAAFTVVQAYTIGVLVSFYDQSLVLTALGLTFAVVFGLTLFTFQTKRDFTSMGSGLFAASCVLLLGLFVNMVLGNSMFDFALSIGGAMLFSLFIVYDTKLLMTQLSPEEYILATINLYLDIVNLFIYILRILEAARRS